MAYTIVKFVHILLAIVAVGFNVSYSVWFARAATDRQHLEFALKGVKFLDDTFANPAYILLMVSGVLMVWIGHLSLTTFWIGAAFILWAVAILVGYLVYTPALRQQIAALQQSGADSADYRAVNTRGTVAGAILGVLVLLILLLMVFKPT